MSVIGREALGEMNIFIITMLIVGTVLCLSYKQAHGELKINPKIRKIVAVFFVVMLMLNIIISLCKLISS